MGRVCCLLCLRSEENNTTGALSTKLRVTAHQNCLLFSSGICCRDSPQYDDLFGFSVEDVMEEVTRGKKLRCSRCKRSGATAGCEVKRCKKNYHYPCAVENKAHIIEDRANGKYVLYCLKHREKMQENALSDNGSASSSSSSSTKQQTSKNPNEAGTSKVYCLACENKEGSICLDSLSNDIKMMYCEKHLPQSQKNNNGDSPAAGPSVDNSDSPSGKTLLSTKRPLRSSDTEDEADPKPGVNRCKRKRSFDSSSSDENTPSLEMAPLESDLEESANSLPESQVISKDIGSCIASTSVNTMEDEHEGEDADETTLVSDGESERLQLPVQFIVDSESQTWSSPTAIHVKTEKREDKESNRVDSPDPHTAGPSVPQPISSSSPAPPDHINNPTRITDSPPSPIPAPIPDPGPATSPAPPAAPPSDPDPELDIDSASFWKGCNTAGCTQAIFTDFTNKMNNIFSRIMSDQASKEDYDCALKVMVASGKLAEFELQKKVTELRVAAAAMEKVLFSLKSQK